MKTLILLSTIIISSLLLYGFDQTYLDESNHLSVDSRQFLSELLDCGNNCNDKGYLDSVEQTFDRENVKLSYLYNDEGNPVRISMTEKEGGLLGFFIKVSVDFREDLNIDTITLKFLGIPIPFQSEKCSYEFYENGAIKENICGSDFNDKFSKTTTSYTPLGKPISSIRYSEENYPEGSKSETTYEYEGNELKKTTIVITDRSYSYNANTGKETFGPLTTRKDSETFYEDNAPTRRVDYDYGYDYLGKAHYQGYSVYTYDGSSWSRGKHYDAEGNERDLQLGTIN